MTASNLIRAGAHRAVAVAEAPAFGYTSKGTEQIAIRFKICGGYDHGRELTWFGYFSERAADRTLAALRACGWTGDNVAGIEAGDLPNEVEIVVEHDEYDGTTRAKVQWINAPRGGKIKLAAPMDDAALRKFGASMKARAKKAPLVEGAPPTDSDERAGLPGPGYDDAPGEDDYDGPPPAEDGDPGPSGDIPF